MNQLFRVAIFWMVLAASLSGCVQGGGSEAVTGSVSTPGEEDPPQTEPQRPEGGSSEPEGDHMAEPEQEPPPVSEGNRSWEDQEPDTPEPMWEPHVVVAIADSGVNPYHEVFYRPERTEHPCTYIEGFPCGIPALNLSIGEYDDYLDAVSADMDTWRAVKEGDWFWIPKTVFVAVGCQSPRTGDSHPGLPPEPICILDDNDNHGTGIASAVLSENPGALLVMMESHNQDHVEFDKAGIPIDVYSHSNGFNGPSPYVGPLGPLLNPLNPIYVRAAGNQPDTTYDKYSRAHPDVIAVGGGFAQDRTAAVITTKTVDVVSYFYRPAASATSTTAMELHGGTSIAAPTVAGAVSKVILRLRMESGHTGSIEGRMVDPLSGVSIGDLRRAINLTASYSPEPEYDTTWASSGNPLAFSVPLVDEAPWLQWGWGFYDSLVANDTIALLVGGLDPPEKPGEAVAYQETQYEVRKALYGW